MYVNTDRLGYLNEQLLQEYLDTTDDQIGRLLDAVDDADNWDDVLVILSTDHGGSGYRYYQ